MSDRDVKSWMERISSDVEMLKRRLIRRPGGGGGVPDPLTVNNLNVTGGFVSDGTAVFSQGHIGSSPILHEAHNMRRFATRGELNTWAPPHGTLAYVTTDGHRGVYMRGSANKWVMVLPYISVQFDLDSVDDFPLGTVAYVEVMQSWYKKTVGGWIAWHDDYWTSIPIRSGFSNQGSNERFKVKRDNGFVVFRWGVSNAGITATNTNYSVADLPAGFPKPPGNWYFTGISSAAQATPAGHINESGVIVIRTNTILGNYYLLDGVRYPIDLTLGV